MSDSDVITAIRTAITTEVQKEVDAEIDEQLDREVDEDEAAIIPFPAPPTPEPINPAHVAFVCVPRDVAEAYWHRPWAEVVEAAAAGCDGLTIESPDHRRGVVFLRHGDGARHETTLVYQQNW